MEQQGRSEQTASEARGYEMRIKTVKRTANMGEVKQFTGKGFDSLGPCSRAVPGAQTATGGGACAAGWKSLSAG